VLVVLLAFTLGVVVGVLGMVPRWWRERQAVKQSTHPTAAVATDKEVLRGA
jgi:hypothetical protein